MRIFKDYRLWLVAAAAFSLLGGAAAVTGYNYSLQAKTVCVAGTPIEQNQAVKPGDLIKREIPRGNVYQDAVSDPAQVRGLVARGYIPAGTVLRLSMLTPAAAASPAGQIGVIGDGYRGVPIPASVFTTVAGAVCPGDRVDIWAMPFDARAQVQTPSGPLAADVLVIQGAKLEAKDGQGTQNSQGVIVALTEEQFRAVYPYLVHQPPALLCVVKPVGGAVK